MLFLAGCGGSQETSGAPAPAATPAPREDRPPFTAAGERPAPPSQRHRWTTARVRTATVLRIAPAGRAVARLGRRTEFGSARVLPVVGRRGPWLEVIATERPNGRTGWIRAADTALGGTDWSVHADLSERTVELRRHSRVMRRFTVAVGRPDAPTPRGRFGLTDKLVPSDPGSPYGCCLLLVSGHQPDLISGWTGGDRLALHGTSNEASVGMAASLGCLRARRGDARAMMRRLPLGTPVFFRA